MPTPPSYTTESPADLADRLLQIMAKPVNGFLLEGPGCPLHDDAQPGPTPSYLTLPDLRLAAYPDDPPPPQNEDGSVKQDPLSDRIRGTLRKHLMARVLVEEKKLTVGGCACQPDDDTETEAQPYDAQRRPTVAYRLTEAGRRLSEERGRPGPRWAV